jgi:hypothetical protein
MQKERIAIIGVGCRFPGGVSDTESLWNFSPKTRRRGRDLAIAGTWSGIMTQPGLAGKSIVAVVD